MPLTLMPCRPHRGRQLAVGGAQGASERCSQLHHSRKDSRRRFCVSSWPLLQLRRLHAASASRCDYASGPTSQFVGLSPHTADVSTWLCLDAGLWCNNERTAKLLKGIMQMPSPSLRIACRRTCAWKVASHSQQCSRMR